ncbi:MAG: hypothetical protein ABI664_22575 [bacterium]
MRSFALATDYCPLVVSDPAVMHYPASYSTESTVPNIRTIALVAIALAASACATQGAPSPDAASPTGAAAQKHNPDVITHAEIDDPSIGDLDALSIIKRLRPAFLATRGGASSVSSPSKGIQVTIGGGPLQNISTLTSIRASEMIEIRYLNAAAAAQAYGSAAGAAGVIVIKRK